MRLKLDVTLRFSQEDRELLRALARTMRPTVMVADTMGWSRTTQDPIEDESDDATIVELDDRTAYREEKDKAKREGRDPDEWWKKK